MANFEIKGEYLLITPSREYSVENYKQAIREAVALCKEHGLAKILADARTFEKNIPALDRFEMGVDIASVLGSKTKFAVVLPSALIDRLGENAAVNRGGRVFVTDSMESALEWLEVAR